MPFFVLRQTCCGELSEAKPENTFASDTNLGHLLLNGDRKFFSKRKKQIILYIRQLIKHGYRTGIPIANFFFFFC